MGALREVERAIRGLDRFTLRLGHKTPRFLYPGAVVPSNSELMIKQRFVTAGCGVTAEANGLSSSPRVTRATTSTRSFRRTKTQTDEDRRAVVPVR